MRLVEVARDCGTEAHLIDNADEVREEWLQGRARGGHLLRRERAREPRAGARRATSASAACSDISEFHVISEDVRFMLPKPIRELAAAGEAS